MFSTLYGREDQLIDFFNLEKPTMIKNTHHNPSKEYAQIIENILTKNNEG